MKIWKGEKDALAAVPPRSAARLSLTVNQPKYDPGGLPPHAFEA
ncbi:MAG: hypothetical protein ABL959_05750 [Pyrinomonadaceae bacterium]